MISNNYKTRVCLLFMVLISGCRATSITREIPQYTLDVISLKENIDLLEETAHQWDEKAYLADVNIPLYLEVEDNPLWLISATFQSPDKHTQTLAVYLNLDNTVSVKKFTHEFGVQKVDPISPIDQYIDSSVALEYFENIDVIGSLRGGELVSLYLEYLHPKPDEPLVWRLSTFSYETGNGNHILINAITGDELDIIR